MTAYDDEIQEYQQKKAALQRQIEDMKSKKFGLGEKQSGTLTADAIRQAEGEIAILDTAIATLRDKTRGQ
jgi:predicted  nucleic acid-binding Zn-ribbon protein